MKKFLIVPVIAVFFCTNFSCQSPGKDQAADADSRIELTVEPGEHWKGKMKVAFFSVKKTPQMAAWIEDNDGNYISTITVTSRGAKEKWRGSPKDGRPDALPVWNRKRQASSADIDSVSTATPSGSVEAAVDSGSLIDGNIYNVYLEINHSFDYNDYWNEGNSGVNGQPSLIYHAQFTAGQAFRRALVPVGHGSVDGSDGNIIEGLENFTSALAIVRDVFISGK